MPSYDVTSSLLPGLKSRGFVPVSQTTFSTADILRMATEEMQGTLVPLLLSVREEYFVTSSDTALVPGTYAYGLPSRAIGGNLRDLIVVDTDGNTFNVTQKEPEDVVGWADSTGRPEFFVFEGNALELYPTPQTGTTDSLRQSYHQRPNALVATAAAGIVASTTSTTVVLTAAASTYGFTTSTPLDFVRATPGFECRAIDVTPTVVSSSTLTFAAGVIPTGLAVGDYVCLAQESPVPQLPVELHPVLQMLTVRAMLEGLGDTEMAEVVAAKADQKMKAALVLIAKRVKGETRKQVNGFQRWRGASRGWGGG